MVFSYFFLKFAAINVMTFIVIAETVAFVCQQHGDTHSLENRIQRFIWRQQLLQLRGMCRSLVDFAFYPDKLVPEVVALRMLIDFHKNVAYRSPDFLVEFNLAYPKFHILWRTHNMHGVKALYGVVG